MKIGPFVITRVRKTAAGLPIYPWQALTEDRVSPELRQVVAKVARSEAKSWLQELREDGAEPCTGPHECRPGVRVAWCRKSCSECAGDIVQPCYVDHTKLWEASA